MRQTATFRDRAEVLVHVARIIGLVKILREEFEQPFIIRLITALERIHNNQAPAWFEHPRAFANYRAAHLGGNS